MGKRGVIVTKPAVRAKAGLCAAIYFASADCQTDYCDGTEPERDAIHGVSAIHGEPKLYLTIGMLKRTILDIVAVVILSV